MRNLLLSLAFFATAVLFSAESHAQCANGITYNVTPGPPYANGQVVTICFTVGSYTQNSSNWIHAFLFTLGSAWDPNSIVVTQFPAGGGGTWGYYNSVTSSATGQTYGPGVFYDLNNDGNPGNNYGYSCAGCSSTLCLQATIANSAGVTDFTIAVTGDGTTGSWGGGTGACGPDATTGTQVINTPPCNYSITPVTVNPICTASNGSITVTPTGGTAPFSYAWSTGAAGNTVNNLGAGVYVVTATDGAGCQTTANANLVANFSNLPSITSNVTPPSCLGNDGSATVSVTGGTQPVSYNWWNGNNTNAVSNLTAGGYGVTATDANGCSVAASVNVAGSSEQATLSLQLQQAITCHDYCNGSVLADAVGTPPYTFAWSDGSYGSSVSGLCAGDVTVTLTDAHQCSDVATLTLDNPPALAVSFTTQPASCYGVPDGSVAALVQNGTVPYQFAWTPAAGDTSALPAVAGGSYYVLVTDLNGCTAVGGTVVDQPLPLALDFQTHDAKCNGSSDGYIEFAAAQGTAPYTFLWSNGTALSSDEDLTGLAAGSYTVTATDASGCTVDSSVTVGEPTPLTASLGALPASCEVANNGKDTAYASGGTPGYNYVWNTVPQTVGLLAENLHPGTYSVTVTDAHNCAFVDSNVVIGLPVFAVHASASAEMIRGYTALVSVSLDTFGSFNYEWSPLIDAVDPYSPNTVVMPDSTTTFTVMVTNTETGCQNSDTVVITVTPNPYVHVPNAFSPNGDGMNDMFHPIPGDGVKIKSFRVFDRWGESVFNDDWFPGWDGRFKGKASPLGIYTYYCEFTIPDGTLKVKQGTVLLLR